MRALRRIIAPNLRVERRTVEQILQVALLLLQPLASVEHLLRLVVEDVLALHLDLRPVLGGAADLLGELDHLLGPRRGEEEHLDVAVELLLDPLRLVALQGQLRVKKAFMEIA